MTHKHIKKLLIGKKDIMEHYQMSETVFYMFLKCGLPVRYFNNRIYAYTDNVDEFFKKHTKGGPPVQVSDEPYPAIEEPI